jgi:hypothetical protein
MSLTPSERRALIAVHSGRVIRDYHANGNTLRGPVGVASTTLWRLSRRKLIDDDPASGGHYRVKQVLTRAGYDAAIAANIALVESIQRVQASMTRAERDCCHMCMVVDDPRANALGQWRREFREIERSEHCTDCPVFSSHVAEKDAKS